MSWCAYKVSENKVENFETIIIKPDSYQQQTGENKSMKFSEAMSKFTDFTFREIIMQNFAYKLIIEGQWVVDSFLKIIVENY